MPTSIDTLSDDTRDELARLAMTLSGNQKTRKGFLGLMKEAAPDTPIPEIDEPARIETALQAEREARSKLEGEFRDYKLGNDLAAKRSSVAERYGLSDDQVKAMEERMGKKELPHDYEWAARLYQQELEPAAPSNYGLSGHGLYEMPSSEGLMDNEQRWSLKTAHGLIDEIQRKNRTPSF